MHKKICIEKAAQIQIFNQIIYVPYPSAYSRHFHRTTFSEHTQIFVGMVKSKKDGKNHQIVLTYFLPGLEYRSETSGECFALVDQFQRDFAVLVLKTSFYG